MKLRTSSGLSSAQLWQKPQASVHACPAWERRPWRRATGKCDPRRAADRLRTIRSMLSPSEAVSGTGSICAVVGANCACPLRACVIADRSHQSWPPGEGAVRPCIRCLKTCRQSAAPGRRRSATRPASAHWRCCARGCCVRKTSRNTRRPARRETCWPSWPSRSPLRRRSRRSWPARRPPAEPLPRQFSDNRPLRCCACRSLRPQNHASGCVRQAVA